jgi:hypothetical protein
MTFLSKLGAILLKGVAIATGFSQVLGQQLPGGGGAMVQKISKDLAEIAQIIVTIEAVGQLKGLPGAEKAKAAGPLIAQIILQSTIMTGQKINDATLFNQGCVNIAGGMADVLNSLHPDGAKETKPE